VGVCLSNRPDCGSGIVSGGGAWLAFHSPAPLQVFRHGLVRRFISRGFLAGVLPGPFRENMLWDYAGAGAINAQWQTVVEQIRLLAAVGAF